jgi:hypothetical protein
MTRETIDPYAKKARLVKEKLLPFEFIYCQKLLLATTDDKNMPCIPESLSRGGKTRNNLGKLRDLVDAHGFRTSVVESPRPALSIYKDSFHINNEDDVKGKTFLVTMFGLNPDQISMERFYSTSFKNVFCLMLFCDRLRKTCHEALQNDKVAKLINEDEHLCRSLAAMNDSKALEEAHALSSSVPERIASLIQLAVQAEPRNRADQLQREYDRIALCNSTLSNAFATLFQKAHDCSIKDIYFKRSHVAKYERITIYVYDSEIDMLKPPQFLFIPSLKTALEEGPESIVKEMMESFWSHLLRHGYFATPFIKTALDPDLEKFFLSGITSDLNIPLQL